MQILEKFLADNQLDYEKYEHLAVKTIEDLEKLPQMNAGITKNLFLKDKSGKYILLVVDIMKSVDLKAFTEAAGLKKLSFASAEDLKKYLGVDPGATTLLGLINDPENQVEVFIDQALWDSNDRLQCHPLISTASFVLSKPDLSRFVELTGHTINFTTVPSRG